MRWHHASGAAALTVLCVALTTACDPQDLPDEPDEAWVSVRVGADAAGVVTVALGGGLDDEQVSALIESLDGDVFVDRPSTGEVIVAGGRLVVMSYHSLEDRMAKNYINKGKVFGEVDKDFFGNEIKPFEAVNRKPIEASEEEIEENSRARSAKLRVATKL